LGAEFSSLSWLAKDPEAALKGIRKLVAEVLREMSKESEAFPEPIALRRYSGKFMVRVPPHVHRELAIQAAEADVSLNRLGSSKLVDCPLFRQRLIRAERRFWNSWQGLTPRKYLEVLNKLWE